MDTAGQVAEVVAVEEQARIRAINMAWNAYYGAMPKPLKTRSASGEPIPDDNLLLPYPALIVDKGRSFLFGQGVEVEVQDNEPAQAWVDKAWEYNQRDTLLNKLALAGGVAGHAFLKIKDDITQPYPRLIVLDPANVRVVWDEDDIEVVTGYRIMWTTTRNGKVIAKRQRIDINERGTWDIVDEESRGDGARWAVVNTQPWPHPFPPVVDCQNLPATNTYYGISDLDSGLLAVSNGINGVLSRINRILRYHAYPKTVATGMKPSDLHVGTDEVLFTPPGSALGNLEMTSDLGSSLSLYERLVEVLFESARIPEVARGKMESIGNLSGVALRILYEPIAEKTEDKRRLYGALITNATTAMLTLGGFGETEVTLHWPELVPVNPKEDAEAALLLQQSGVSRDTTLQRMGFDADEEATKRAAESDAMAEAAGAAFDAGEGQEGVPTGDDDAKSLATRINAAAQLIRSGFDPSDALRAVGLDPIKHLGLLPVTVQSDSPQG